MPDDVRELRKLLKDEYTRGWNNALDAVLETMLAHPIEWMSDRSFRDMEAGQKDAIERLRRPEGMGE
jgi:hypothetical protein